MDRLPTYPLLVSGLVLAASIISITGCESKQRPSQPQASTQASTSAPSSQPAEPTGPHPKIAADKEVIDLGVKWSTEGVHKTSFTLSNAGDEPLHIKGVQSSCGCTTVGEKSITLAPAETWKLPIEIDLKEQQSFVGHTISVFSNDPTRPKMELKIRGIVRQPITLTPPNGMFFGVVEPDEKKTKELTLRNNTDEPMAPKVVKCTNDTFTAGIESIKPGKEYKVILKARPPYKVDNNRGVIEIETGLSRQPKIAIRPQAQLTPRIVATTVVQLPQPLPSGAIRQVFVRNNGTTPIKVTKVTTELKGVTSEIEAVQGGKVHNIKLRFPPGFELPERGGNVVVHTTDAEENEIPIMVTRQALPPGLPSPP